MFESGDAPAPAESELDTVHAGATVSPDDPGRADGRRVSVGVPTFLVRGDVYFWGSLMAGCFIASVPIAIVYNFFVDRFIAGFTVGAIK